MRIFTIGDVHGCIKTLEKLLEKINFSKSDKLIFLGDLVDRGPDTKAVLDLILKLKYEAYDVDSVLGNHELMMFESLIAKEKLKYWKDHGGSKVLSNFNVQHPEEIPKKYFDLILKFPIYLEIGNYLLVHAGLNFDIDDPLEDKEAMLWKRNQNGIDDTKLKGKTMIVGHTPKSKDKIEESLKSSRIFLDGGCVFENNNKLGKLR